MYVCTNNHLKNVAYILMKQKCYLMERKIKCVELTILFRHPTDIKFIKFCGVNTNTLVKNHLLKIEKTTEDILMLDLWHPTVMD